MYGWYFRNNQSYKKYPTKEEWLNGFLRTTFENCFYGLKKGKYMAINIANVKSFPNLEKETIKIDYNKVQRKRNKYIYQ